MKRFLDIVSGLLMLAVVLLIVGLFAFCIAAGFIGDGFSDGEQAVAIRITVALVFTVLAGGILDIIRGKE